jgi:DNA-binding beta-propeller fold protein YncE
MLDRRELLGLGMAAVPALLRARRGTARPAAAAAATAFVTADTEAHVAVVVMGAASGRVVRRIRTVEDPRSIERSPGGRVAIVGHAGAGVISLLDLRERRVRRVLRGFGAPRYTAFAPGGRLAYVSDGAEGEVAVVDVRAGRVLRRVAAGDGARHLSLRPDGRVLWVALGSSAAQIAVLDLTDPERPRRTGTIRPPFLAHDVAFSPSGRRVWVTAGREPRLAILSASTHAPIRILPAARAPQHIAFGPDVAYIASGDAGLLVIHTLTDGHIRRRTRIPRGSYNIQRTGSHTITPSLGTGALTLLDPRGRLVRSVHVADHAHDACLG